MERHGFPDHCFWTRLCFTRNATGDVGKKEMIHLILALIFSYLVGSIPTAYLVGKAVKGLDIRKYGSGNVGATNVFRVVGKGWGILVLLFDAVKGAFVVLFLPRFFPSGSLHPFLSSLLCGILAISGHAWTVWLGFKGGKGVATSAGVFLSLAPKAATIALIVWVLIFFWKRYVSLASISTAASFPFWVFFFYRSTERFPVLFPVSLLLVAFILYTHRSNIRRLLAGTEKKLL